MSRQKPHLSFRTEERNLSPVLRLSEKNEHAEPMVLFDRVAHVWQRGGQMRIRRRQSPYWGRCWRRIKFSYGEAHASAGACLPLCFSWSLKPRRVYSENRLKNFHIS